VKWTDTLRGYLPFVRRPKYNSKFGTFQKQYKWLYSTANKSLGDYTLFDNAEENVYVYRSIEAISDTLLINGYSINDLENQNVNFERKKYLENLFENPEGYSSDITYAMFHKQYIRSFELTGDAFIEVDYEEFTWDDTDFYKVVNGFQFIPPDILKWYPDTEQWGFRLNPEIWKRWTNTYLRTINTLQRPKIWSIKVRKNPITITNDVVRIKSQPWLIRQWWNRP